MSEVTKAKLQEKKAMIQQQFDKLEALRKQEAEKQAAIQRNLAEIVTEQTRLQGDNRVVDELLAGYVDIGPTEEEPPKGNSRASKAKVN